MSADLRDLKERAKSEGRKGVRATQRQLFLTALGGFGKKVACPAPCALIYPGARYHVMSRGDRREDIFWESSDREMFLGLLEGPKRGQSDNVNCSWHAPPPAH